MTMSVEVAREVIAHPWSRRRDLRTAAQTILADRDQLVERNEVIVDDARILADRVAASTRPLTHTDRTIVTAWRALIDVSHVTRFEAARVAELAEVCERALAENARLREISRADVPDNVTLAKHVRDLTGPTPLVRPPATGTPSDPVVLPAVAPLPWWRRQESA